MARSNSKLTPDMFGLPISENGEMNVILTNADFEEGILPSREFTGLDVSIDLLDDERFSGHKTKNKQYVAHCFFGSACAGSFYCSGNDVRDIANEYELIDHISSISPMGEIPEESISWNEFLKHLNNISLSDELREWESADFEEHLFELNGSDMSEESLSFADYDNFAGIAVIESVLRTGEREEYPLFIIPDVKQPTIVRRPRATSDKDPIALILPSLKYKYNEYIKGWVYDEDLSRYDVLVTKMKEDGELIDEEVMPFMQLVANNDVADKRILDLALSITNE